MQIEQLYKKGKSFFVELSTNTIAFSLLIFSQQFVALPLISRKELVNFGNILTIFAIINIVASLLGNGLGQAKLVQKQKYLELGDCGDFKFILRMFSFISFILGSLVSFIFSSSYLQSLLLGILFLLSMIRSYTVFDFRYNQKTKEILYSNLVYSSSLIMITILYYIYNLQISWIIIFLTVEFITFIYYFRRINIFKENKKRTKLFKETLSQSLLLSFNGGLSYILNSSDRLLINPLIGSTAVAIYYSGAFVSKIGALILNPLNGVLLGRLANYKDKSLNNILKRIIALSLIIVIVYFIILLLISPLFIKLLYPTYYGQAINIYVYTSLASAFSASLGIVKQVFIRYGSAKKLSILLIIYAIVFIGLALPMTINNGVLGFAISTVISNIFLYLALLFLFFQLRRNNIQKTA